MSILFDPTEIRGMALRNRFVRSATYDGCAQRTAMSRKNNSGCLKNLPGGVSASSSQALPTCILQGRFRLSRIPLPAMTAYPGFRNLAETVHKAGAKIAVQLFHAGREVAKVFGPERKEALAPSLIQDDPYFQQPHRAVTEDEIWEIVRAFGDAAKRAREAGLDAVQVHAAHAYLLSQFLSPFTNRRTDPWGGNLENRLRLHHEIYRDIRAKAGEDYPCPCKNRGPGRISRGSGIP